MKIEARYLPKGLILQDHHCHKIFADNPHGSFSYHRDDFIE